MRQRTAAFILTLVALLVAQLALWPAAGPVDPLQYGFTPEEVARAVEYQRPRLLLWGASALAQLVLLVFAATPTIARGLAMSARSIAPRSGALRLTVTLALVWGTLLIFRLPTSYARGYRHDLQYGLVTQTPREWLGDFLLSQGITFVLLLAAALAVAQLSRWLGPRGWLAAAVLGFLSVPALQMAAPVAIAPLFHDDRGLSGVASAEPLGRLATSRGIPLDRVFVRDASRRTRKLNAAVTGLGPTSRIILWDTLLAEATSPESRLVFAHEIGHWEGRHVRLGALLGGLGLALLCLLLGQLVPKPALEDVPKLMAAAMACLLVTLPLQNHVSRKMERSADEASLAITGEAETFVQSELRLARSNLSHPAPSPFWVWLFHTHPPATERIAMGRAWARRSAP